jgi:hypothetical protein
MYSSSLPTFLVVGRLLTQSESQSCPPLCYLYPPSPGARGCSKMVKVPSHSSLTRCQQPAFPCPGFDGDPARAAVLLSWYPCPCLSLNRGRWQVKNTGWDLAIAASNSILSYTSEHPFLQKGPFLAQHCSRSGGCQSSATANFSSYKCNYNRFLCSVGVLHERWAPCPCDCQLLLKKSRHPCLVPPSVSNHWPSH